MSLDYNTLNGTARSGTDFSARSGTLVFADGETFKDVTIPIFNDGLVESDEQFGFAIDNLVGNATLLAPRTATVIIDDNDAIQGTGNGLLGEYFNSTNLTNRVATRVDRTIQFDWQQGRALPALGVDNFSIRWTGQIEARFSENYTFTTSSDDGVRLWINDRLLIDQLLLIKPSDSAYRSDRTRGWCPLQHSDGILRSRRRGLCSVELVQCEPGV